LRPKVEWSQDDHLSYEAVEALRKIGPDATLILIRVMDDQKSAQLFRLFVRYRSDLKSVIDPSAIPVLVTKVKNSKADARSVALEALWEHAFDGKENEAALMAEIAKQADAEAFCESLYKEFKGYKDRYNYSRGYWILETLGPKAAPIAPTIISDLQEMIKTVKKEIKERGLQRAAVNGADIPLGRCDGDEPDFQ
jgi:hypothetical protein